MSWSDRCTDIFLISVLYVKLEKKNILYSISEMHLSRTGGVYSLEDLTIWRIYCITTGDVHYYRHE